ncbi:hypothetical protein BJY52DRAFT_1420390 [Lactarius psammicola]|nr:hypothetical protein BJY52DRAFT_1420390 [Lactarius psammicola]
MFRFSCNEPRGASKEQTNYDKLPVSCGPTGTRGCLSRLGLKGWPERIRFPCTPTTRRSGSTTVQLFNPKKRMILAPRGPAIAPRLFFCITSAFSVPVCDGVVRQETNDKRPTNHLCLRAPLWKLSSCQLSAVNQNQVSFALVGELSTVPDLRHDNRAPFDADMRLGTPNLQQLDASGGGA